MVRLRLGSVLAASSLVFLSGCFTFTGGRLFHRNTPAQCCEPMCCEGPMLGDCGPSMCGPSCGPTGPMVSGPMGQGAVISPLAPQGAMPQLSPAPQPRLVPQPQSQPMPYNP